MVHSFKIDLKGIIDLLSNHLYSDPSVFVRELLQNAVDAITARKNAGDRFDPNIQVTVESEGETKRLVFEDNGIGLTEDEIHEFLATIGRSSKRISEARESYLGQFGIGLLSCFMVSKEIRVYTQSSKGGTAACWIAQPDGTYEISQTNEAPEVGTRVILEAREDFDYLFDFENLQEDLFGYGEILPYPIHLSSGDEYAHVNAVAVPWVTYAETGDPAQKEQVLAYARERLGLEALDCFPLKTQAGGVSGVAFVLPYSTQSNSRQWHRVYLKNMLLSSQIDNLLPEWAFFVRCFLNVQGLHPTASRESFYEDELLTQARTELNQQMQAWIRHLTQHDQEGLRRLLQLHYLPMRALAVDNDEFYQLLVHSFSFETSTGHMTLGDYLKSNSVIRYVTNLDQFRQISQVASAYGHSVINAVYTYDIPILRKYTSMFGVPTEEIDATTYAHTLEDVQSEGLKDFLLLAQDALSSLECQVTVKKFIPDTLPALFIVSEVHQELSDIEQAQEVSDDLWSDVLEDYASELRSMRVAHLHLNFNNSLVQSMMHAENPKVVRRLVQMLYVQAHLLGHHPMRQEELALLTEGLQEMMYWGLRADRMLN
ncbi:HSP90 family protein [Deinococcus cellulosilyticus]|uniref:Molecular chaperone HtpG n=1 Tax=Deinococcus cellulosilyticus (strain DSM 18568 / NBRC 106333 / KACC 11606 / 5516J-15) TaxID=1223518 RepID=A0A511MXS8_DEIC1|nr:HSP90 family protein [Deinococcus cellulosilyticus]GEM44936.1 molecular chaperone HtpG [Deinococcus cellulosilyticus NBRC 106333 = KACC 11606]